MSESPVARALGLLSKVLPTPSEAGPGTAATAPTPAGQAALATAQALAQKAAAPATLRAYKADWQHYAAWCARTGFTPVPAEPAAVGAYLASLAESHAPGTIRRRLSAIGKMHRFNDLPWNPAHRDIQGPLQGRCARTAASSRRPPPSPSTCCASFWRPVTTARAAGATAPCC